MSVLDRILHPKPKVARSPQWPALRRRWLLAYPRCAACGGTKGLEAHHKKPVHLFPQLELEWSNLITLCERRKCHLIVGHAYDWKRYNPSTAEIAASLLDAVKRKVLP